MVKFTVIISIVVLIAALFLLFDKLFTPQPIQIVLESGQEVTTNTPNYFSLSEVLLMVISAFLIGTAAIYLFYNSSELKTVKLIKKTEEKNGKDAVYDSILPLLKHEEKQVVNFLRDSGGQVQQNKLVLKLNTSKVRVTRILHSLQQKDLIVKERHGLTNMVKLKK